MDRRGFLKLVGCIFVGGSVAPLKLLADVTSQSIVKIHVGYGDYKNHLKALAKWLSKETEKDVIMALCGLDK